MKGDGPGAVKRPGVAALAWLLVFLLGLTGGCFSEEPSQERPGGGAADSPLGSVPVRMEGGVATVGPYRQILFPRWVNDSKLLALSRHGEGESILELKLGEGGKWTGRTLLTLEPGSEPESFYLWDFLEGGRAITFTSSPSGALWRYDIPSGESATPASEAEGKPPITKVAEPVVTFRLSPDRTRAVIYGPQRAGLLDFRTGVTRELPEVPSYEFPFTGLGGKWSPDASHYLYQKLHGQLMTGFGIVRADTGEVVKEVSPKDGCAFLAEWSPDGKQVAFLVLEGKADAYFRLEDELSPPVGHKLAILDLGAGQVTYVAVPKMLITGRPVWSPGGDAVAFAAGVLEDSKEAGSRVYSHVYVASRSDRGWTATAVTGETPGRVARNPCSWSPGGRALAFTASGDGEPELGVVRWEEGSEGRWGFLAPVMLGHVDSRVVWLDDRTLVGEVTRAGATPPAKEICILTVAGEQLGTLEGSLIWFADLVLSPRRQYLAYTMDVPDPQDSDERLSLLRIRPTSAVQHAAQ